MGLTRADLIGNMSDEERKSRQDWIDRTSSNDIWAKKIFNEVGILMTSHQGNRPYMKACIESHAKLGLWITLAYDNYIDPNCVNDNLFPKWQKVDHNNYMPPKDVMDLVDTFIMPHHQVWGGPLYPYFWLLKFGAAAMQNFKYIYCTNSDFVLEKPEGFWELFKMVKDGDYDVMTSGHDEPGRYANTAGFIIKSDAFLKVVQHMQDHFIPWDVYEKYTQTIGNAEGRFGKAIFDCGLKQLIVTPPDDDMLRIPGTGTWYQLMGFRHTHAEINHAYRKRAVPPPLKYLDERFLSENDYVWIKKYEETGDISVLENWWAKD